MTIIRLYIHYQDKELATRQRFMVQCNLVLFIYRGTHTETEYGEYFQIWGDYMRIHATSMRRVYFSVTQISVLP